MVKYRKIMNYYSVITYLLLPFFMNAQQSFNGGGIGIKNNIGSVEFSIGQVDYGVSNTNAGIQSMGIQQPFYILKQGLVSSLACDTITLIGDKIQEKRNTLVEPSSAIKEEMEDLVRAQSLLPSK